jgi:hypothetical protein
MISLRCCAALRSHSESAVGGVAADSEVDDGRSACPRKMITRARPFESAVSVAIGAQKAGHFAVLSALAFAG